MILISIYVDDVIRFFTSLEITILNTLLFLGVIAVVTSVLRKIKLLLITTFASGYVLIILFTRPLIEKGLYSFSIFING